MERWLSSRSEVLTTLRGRGERPLRERAKDAKRTKPRVQLRSPRPERDPAGDLQGALAVPKSRQLLAITTPDGASELMRAFEASARLAIKLFALGLSAHITLAADTGMSEVVPSSWTVWRLS